MKQKSLNVLMVFTGGTIGSVRYKTKENVWVKGQPKDIIKEFPESKKYFESTNAVTILLDKFKEMYPKYFSQIHFETHLDMEVLSENMTIDVWNCLLKKLNNKNFNNYDAIIITHGTDTLAYTANLLSVLYSNVNKPIFIVSSNDSLDSKNANGIDNLKGAIDFLLQENLNGVFVPYTTNNVTKIIYGSRITQCKQIIDDFSGINENYINNDFLPLGIITKNADFLIQDYDLYKQLLYSKRKEQIVLQNDLKNSVLLLKPYVGLNYDNYSLENISGVLHSCYHSGTACTIAKSSDSILQFIRKCADKSIDFYYGPVYGLDDKAIYDSTYAVNKNGANIIKNISLENAYVKLLIGYANYCDKSKITEFLNNDINNEHIYKRERKK